MDEETLLVARLEDILLTYGTDYENFTPVGLDTYLKIRNALMDFKEHYE